MTKGIQTMINKHKELVADIVTIQNAVYGEVSKDVNPIEYANLAVQLRGMKMYEEALRARLTNRGVIWENGEYFEHLNLEDNNK